MGWIRSHPATTLLLGLGFLLYAYLRFEQFTQNGIDFGEWLWLTLFTGLGIYYLSVTYLRHIGAVPEW